jgi:parallel beta-helix repeat protein
MKVEGNMEDDVAAYADNETDGLLRLMALIRHKHRNESGWDPGTPNEFAVDMLMRQVQDLSMGYRTRGMFGTSWKEYGRLSAAAQGKFEGYVLRMVTISHARRSAQVAAFHRKFDDRPIPTTKEEADRLMADMISEAIGRRVEPPTSEAPGDSGPPPASINGASPQIDENDVWDNAGQGMMIAGAGTDPLVRANRVHDNPSDGIDVRDGATPRIEGNVVRSNGLGGIVVAGAGTDPVVRANRVHDGLGNGIFAVGGASPRIEENEVWGNAHPGIWIGGAGTHPLVRANRVHDGHSNGITVVDGASAMIEDNDIWANADPGVAIADIGTDPVVRGNRVHDCRGGGITVGDGSMPQIEDNEVWGNGRGGMTFQGSGTKPVVRANHIHDEDGGGIWVVSGASPRLEDNEVFAQCPGRPRDLRRRVGPGGPRQPYPRREGRRHPHH